MATVLTSGKRHGSIKLPWLSIVLATGATIAYVAFGAAPEMWVFDRAAITQGEWWRLLTGHWVHSDVSHATWDIAALLLLGILFEKRLKCWLPLSLFVSTACVDAWLWWGYPSLEQYCGLSGVLNSLLAIGLLQLWCGQRHPVVLLTGIAAVLKILVEVNIGQAVLTQTSWPSIPEVHAVGFVVGLVLGVLNSRHRRVHRMVLGAYL